MTLQKKLANKIKEKKGITLIGILLGVVAFGVLAFPMARWLMKMTQETQELKNQTELQSIVQAYWSRVNAATYDEFQEAIAGRGTTWDDTVGNYVLSIKFSADGKYNNGTCSVGTAAGAADRHCRKATITIRSKDNPSIKGTYSTVKISTFAESQVIKDLKAKLAAINAKFASYNTSGQVNSKLNSYYTKAEEDKKIDERPGLELSGGKFSFSNCKTINKSGSSGYISGSDCTRTLQNTFSQSAYCTIQISNAYRQKVVKLNGKTVLNESSGPGLTQLGIFAKKGDVLYIDTGETSGSNYGWYSSSGIAEAFCFSLK